MNPIVIIYVILFLLSAIYAWQNRVHWNYRIWKYVNKIPGPEWHIPILFHSTLFYGSLEFIWVMLRKMVATYPRIWKLWGFNRSGIFLMEAEDAQLLLTSTVNIQKSEIYDGLIVWLKEGLLISSGNKWKLRRKILTPSFHFNILKKFVNSFEDQTEQIMEKIDAECGKTETNVQSIVLDYTLHALCETTMGITGCTGNAEIKQYKDAILKFGTIYMERVARPWLYPEIIFGFTPMGRQIAKSIEILHKFTFNVINERLRNWDDNEINKNDLIISEEGGKRKMPMMDLLIHQMKQGEDIDISGICEEVDTFMFEGHDTTTMALSLLLMSLANNPHIQNRIYEEQINIFNDDIKRKSTYEDLQKMDYLEMCIKEGLRLYPPVHGIGRRLEEDLQLNGYLLPKGSYVHILIYDLHRNPKYWPNPDKFDPDRFLPENCVTRHPFAYIPFSAGPRNCIGQRFAILEMKSFVSKLIREFILEPIDTPQSITFKLDLVLRTSKPIRVKFCKRI